MFEIKEKDGLGRIGKLTTAHGVITTPTIMPVVNPNIRMIDPARMRKEFGAEVVITNSYIIYKNEELRKKALESGVHKLINFDGPVCTDSGAYQLMTYGDIDVDQKTIVDFQDKIGVDMGVMLDIPSKPGAKKNKIKDNLEETLKRAKEAKGYAKRDDFMLYGPVQGGEYLDLLEHSAREMNKLDFPIYAIGSVVGLLMQYRFDTNVDMIIKTKQNLSHAKPIHLFGAGHPMFFALSTALGCDLYDSAAYALYARDNRLITNAGTLKLEDLVELPCECPICSRHTAGELKRMPQATREVLIAEHNLYVTFAEIRRVREAIREGSLWELVEMRARSHPALLAAYRRALTYSDYIEKFEPVTKKSAFFYGGPESLKRPEVVRHERKMKMMEPGSKNLLVLKGLGRPYEYKLGALLGQIKKKDVDVAISGNVFPARLELGEYYPISQSEFPVYPDAEFTAYNKKWEKCISKKYKKVIDGSGLTQKEIAVMLKKMKEKKRNWDIDKFRAMLDYQYECGIADKVISDKVKFRKSRSTNKARDITEGKETLFTIRAEDTYMIMHEEGAKRLHKLLKKPRLRVVINDDAVPFVKEGKSAFCKFVLNADPEIRCGEEVLLTDKRDNLIGFGTAAMSAAEMLDFKVGVAVKTRDGLL